MSSKYKVRDKEVVYFFTFAVIQWIDVFSRKEYRDILLDSIRHCQDNKGLVLHSWCLMSNHIHLVASSKKDRLEFILRDMKKFTSTAIFNTIEMNPQESRKSWMLWIFRASGKANPHNRNHQFWQQDIHPVELFTFEVMKQKLDYIHNNPVRAGIVEYPEEFLYSSARDYAGKKGLLKVDLLF